MDYPNEYVISLCLFTYLQNGHESIHPPLEYAGIINYLMCVNRHIFESNREIPKGKLLCTQNGLEQWVVKKAWKHTVNNRGKLKFNGHLFSWISQSRNHEKKYNSVMSLNMLAFIDKEGKGRFHSIVSISSFSKEHFIITNALIISENMKRM